MSEMTGELIYIGEAARLLEASRSTVIRMVERGELSCLRVQRGERQFRVFWRSQVLRLMLDRSPRPETKVLEPVAASSEGDG